MYRIKERMRAGGILDRGKDGVVYWIEDRIRAGGI